MILMTNIQKTIILSCSCECDETHVDLPSSLRNGTLQIRVKASRCSDIRLDKTPYVQNMKQILKICHTHLRKKCWATFYSVYL